MPQDIFIGIDGGATKTLARVETAEGTLLGEGRSGPANIRLSVVESWRSVRLSVDRALAVAGLALDDSRYRFHCGLGLAGTEIAAARRAFLATLHPFARMELRSDGYTACLGAHGGADGAVIAIGTGVVALQLHRGREQQVSGWGFPHDDPGGGAWLGLRAVGLTLQWRDGRREGCPLTAAVFRRFDQDQGRLVTWACEADATGFAELAPRVIDAAEAGSEAARQLLEEAALEIDRIGRALVRQAEGRHLPCCLLGGLASFLAPRLGETLRVRLVAPRGDTLQGALLLIRRAVATATATTDSAED